MFWFKSHSHVLSKCPNTVDSHWIPIGPSLNYITVSFISSGSKVTHIYTGSNKMSRYPVFLLDSDWVPMGPSLNYITVVCVRLHVSHSQSAKPTFSSYLRGSQSHSKQGIVRTLKSRRRTCCKDVDTPCCAWESRRKLQQIVGIPQPVALAAFCRQLCFFFCTVQVVVQLCVHQLLRRGVHIKKRTTLYQLLWKICLRHLPSHPNYLHQLLHRLLLPL